ncbi:MAG: hypothetical protein AAGJ82_01115 [Bacteroidota bacterium]
MKTVIKRLFWLTVFLLVLTLGTLVVITSFFQDEIGQRITQELNAMLETEVRIGGFELSVIRTFPSLGVNLQDVAIDGTDGQLLLSAGELSFRAGLLSLLGSELALKSVVLSDGEVNLKTDRRGSVNYDILKTTKDTETSTGSTGTIQLEEARISNMHFRYVDMQANQSGRLRIEKALFSGAFAADEYELDSEAELFFSEIISEGDRLLFQQPLRYQTRVEVDAAKGRYTIQALEAELGDLPLLASGFVDVLPNLTHVDLSIASNGGQLQDVLRLVPSSYAETLAGIETSGEFNLSAVVKGNASEQETPRVDVDVTFADGRVYGDRVSGKVRDLGFVASFTNGERQNERTSKLLIENLRGELEGTPFAMDLSVTDFSNPLIEWTANGHLPPGIIVGFLPDETITAGDGDIELTNLKLQGRYNDMLNPGRINRVKMGGQLTFDGASLTINEREARIPEGTFRLQNNQWTVEDLRLQAPDTDILFRGTASNILPVLFADSLNSQQARLDFDLLLQAERIDLEELLALGAPSEATQAAATTEAEQAALQTAEIVQRERTTKLLNGQFQVDIRQFTYGKLAGEDFKGELRFARGKMEIEGRTQTMNGTIDLVGDMTFSKRPKLEARLTCDDVSAYEFFHQTDNFGQDVLVADNLSGELDARILIQAFFAETGEFLTDKLRVLAGLGIQEGRLRDFKMLEDFSTFVNVKDLRDIRFKNLENFLEVRNGRLHLPVMFVQSNALNLTISGEHSFDNDIEYYLKVNAGQVLMDRFRRHDPSLRPKPARRSDFFNLNYAILGDLDNFNVKSNRKRVQRDFQESERRKQEIRAELERKFSTVIELVEEPADWRDIPEYREDPNSTEPEFLDMEIDGGGF